MLGGGGPHLLYDLPPGQFGGPSGQPSFGDVAALAGTAPAPTDGGTTSATSDGTTAAPSPTPTPGGGPTLADNTAAQNAAGIIGFPSTEDLTKTWNTLLGLAQKAHESALRKPMEEPQHGLGWWLGNIASLGTAGLVQNDYRQAYNLGVERTNQKVREAAVEDAKGLMGAHLQGVIAGHNMNMKLMELNQKLTQNQINTALRLMGLGQGQTRIDIQRNKPLTQAEQDALTDRAKSYSPTADWRQTVDASGQPSWEIIEPSTGHVYERQPGASGAGGGGGAPSGPDITFPVAKPGGPTAAGSAPPGSPSATPATPGAPATPSGQPPAGTPSPHLTTPERAQQKVKLQAQAEMAKEDQKAVAEVKRNAANVESWIASPQFDRAVQIALPKAGGSLIKGRLGETYNELYGAPKAVRTEGPQGDAMQYLKQATSTIVPAVRAFSGGSKGFRIALPELELAFSGDLERLASGAMGQEEAMGLKRRIMGRLAEIKTKMGIDDFGQGGAGGGAGAGAGGAGGGAGAGGGGAPGNILRGADRDKYLGIGGG